MNSLIAIRFVTLLASGTLTFAVPVTNGTVKAPCHVKNFREVEPVLKKCHNIVIDGFPVPAGKTLNLNLMDGSTLTFAGETRFAYMEWEGPLVLVQGKGITVQGQAGHVLNAQGPKYWDGLGDKGRKKPKFFRITATGGSHFNNIHLKDCPRQCVSINNAKDLTLSGWNIDVSRGAPGVAPRGHEGHNTDGFNIAAVSNLLIKDSTVNNQDDCVAINTGRDLNFEGLTCIGGHGLSLSAGGGSGGQNIIENVKFEHCKVINSRNGIHVKTKPEQGTGHIHNVVYKGIILSGITHYGVNVQEDYRNGGSSGRPDKNIPVSLLQLQNVQGTMHGENSVPVYILCANGGCSSWNWSGVKIIGASKKSECNFRPNGYTC